MNGKTVLVVDTNEASRTFLSEALLKNKSRLEASSGKEALIFAWRDQPAYSF